MKNLVYIILSIFTFFSISNITSANKEWYIEKILDLNYWIEEYKIQINDIDYIYFYDEESQKLYDNFRSADKLLKDEIIRLYRDWKIDYYKMNWITQNYNLFIYHTNKMFKYISLKEVRSNLKELDIAILKNYENSRSYYYKTKLMIK